MSYWLLRAPLVELDSEDDLDDLFQQFAPLEPPEECLSRLLSAVRNLPGPLWQSKRADHPRKAGENALIIHNEHRNPC